MIAKEENGTPQGATVDAAEIARFNALAATWWDAEGPMRPLHEIGPVRLSFIRREVVRHFGLKDEGPGLYKGLSMLDVGCAAGLVCEPLARLGAAVTGIDAAEKNIGAAKAHAEASGLAIDYRATTAEALAREERRFDVVIALEIVEHVADVPLFIDALSRLMAPGGLLIMSTINRTAKSYLMAIVGAEYVLRWLPKGTHDWRKFVTPQELQARIGETGLEVETIEGMRLDLFSRNWILSSDTGVNYLLCAARA
jgi:2-polyprenyl-6-hydroxyphenyl methylase/3-demethylubiquinone-9 3-methyltransferase